MHIESIATLFTSVAEAGAIALDAQRRIKLSDRHFKADESIITEVDPMVEGYLVRAIEAHFPFANILAEEKVRHFDPEKPYTFALDPIDGTDAFSQSMAGWCISLGLLDHLLQPIAGIIFAPRLDLMIFADVDSRATLNGDPIIIGDASQTLSKKSNLMVTSSIHRQLDLRRFPGKIRSLGSAALHLAGPVIYPGVYAAADGGMGFIWDVAGAHAVARSVGFAFEFFAGGEVDYTEMVKGNRVGDLILSGPGQRLSALRSCMSRL